MISVSIRSVHSVLTTFANAFRRSQLVVPKLFDASILRPPSASILEEREPLFVLIAALLMSSSLIHSNRTGRTFSIVPLIKLSSEAQLFCGYLRTSSEIVSGLIEVYHNSYYVLVNVMLQWCCLSAWVVWTFLIFQQLLMVFERLLRVFEWFHPKKAVLQVHRFSIGAVSKTVCVLLIFRSWRVFEAKKLALLWWLQMIYLLKVIH